MQSQMRGGSQAAKINKTCDNSIIHLTNQLGLCCSHKDRFYGDAKTFIADFVEICIY